MKQHPFKLSTAIALTLLLLMTTLPSQTVSAQPVLQAADASGIVSDDFNQCSLDTTLWQVDDPLNKLVTTPPASTGVGTDDAVLEMSIPGGETLNITGKKQDAPRIMQPAANTDFEVEAKFESGVSSKFQVQGILVGDDTGNFLRFDFNSNDLGTRMYVAATQLPTTTTMSVFVNSIQVAGNGANPIWMRVNRQGDTWTPTFSLDGENFAGPTDPPGGDASFSWPFNVTQVGVFVGTSGNTGFQPAHTARVDYFMNRAEVLDPEDGPALKVNVNPPDAGTVDVPANPQCNQAISLTATANAGYAFTNWTGDVPAGQENLNPLALTFTGRQEVTANFAAEQYALDATVAAGNGDITKNPDQAQYAAGSQVQLTATPDPGWIFDAWSGDVPAGQENQNPLTITMDGDKTVLATFVEDLPDQYTVTTSVPDGNGTVAKNPNQAQYAAGAQVELTATPDPGYIFDGWSGDVPAGQESQNPLTITVDSDKTIQATFVEAQTNEYTLNATASGGGTVAKSPNQAQYAEGTQVELTATPNDSWVFAGWSGDVPAGQESQNPLTITMDANKSITATFTTNPVYLPIVAR